MAIVTLVIDCRPSWFGSLSLVLKTDKELKALSVVLLWSAVLSVRWIKKIVGWYQWRDWLGIWKEEAATADFKQPI